MTDINDMYCNLEIEFNQETDDGDIIQIELYCESLKNHNEDKDHFIQRHTSTKVIEHGNETTVIHIQWITSKTEELR